MCESKQFYASDDYLWEIQFLEDDSNCAIEVNNSTDIHKQNKATVKISIWGKESFKEVSGKRSQEHY